MSRMNGTSNTKQVLHQELKNALPIIDDRLYFTMSKYARSTDKIHMFSIDHALRYEPFFVDFGPLNLACLYKFCKLLEHKLNDDKYKHCKIYYYCDRTPQRLSNAAYLIGAYQVVELKRNPIEAYARIKPLAEKGVAFRDASMGLCTYHCTVKHCINALYHALRLNFLDFAAFNVDEYEHYERVECGDLNVIVPNKFVAFAGPYFKEFDEEGYPALTPDFYIPIWRKFKVTTIIRLNKKCYDKRIFTKAGFEHHDLYFVDGTTPSEQIIARFNEICETASGVLAVHCKAGLGRTGSCIGCYMMKHYAWTAAQVIAWLRVCRPGSVIGPQQQFLEQQQSKMWKQGDAYRQKQNVALRYDPRTVKFAINHNHRLPRKESSVESAERNHGKNQKDETPPHKPLPTDPGQNQGAVLRHAKAQHQHEHEVEHENENELLQEPEQEQKEESMHHQQQQQQQQHLHSHSTNNSNNNDNCEPLPLPLPHPHQHNSIGMKM